MVLEVSDDKELFRYLGLLSNEVIQIQKSLQTLDTQESQVRAALDELTLEKDILIEQTTQLEKIVKQAATSALEDHEREREYKQTSESERSSLRTRFSELEETLQTKEAAIKDLNEQFVAKIEELTAEIRDKESLLDLRAVVVKDLETATASLNRLVSGLSSTGGSMVLLDDPQEQPGHETGTNIKVIDDRASAELDRLKNDIREKEVALAAKSLEVEITKQKLSSRIEELERALDIKKKKKSPRLVTLLSDMGAKKFM